MSPPRAIASVVLLAMGVLGCRVGFHNGPDRYDDGATMGPPPPSFNCERGTMRREPAPEPKKPDHVLFVVDGDPICDGIDFDHDGRADEWDLLDHGRIVGRTVVGADAGSASADAAP